MRVLSLLLLCALSAGPLLAKEKPPAIYTIPLPPKPDFSPLDWLVGEWKGYTTGRGPRGEIHLSVEFALDKRFLLLHEEFTLPSTDGAPATREAWMGILTPSRSDATFLLRMFSSTGFIMHYRVNVDGAVIHYNPEGGEQPPPGWLFRRVVERSGVSEFQETVQVAPPHKPFFDYYTAKLTRAPTPPAAPPSTTTPPPHP